MAADRTIDEVLAENQRLLVEIEHLRKENKELEEELDQLTRFQKKRYRDRGEDW
jgi:hypothetical protein